MLIHFKTSGASVGALLMAEAPNWYTWGIYLASGLPNNNPGSLCQQHSRDTLPDLL